MFALQAENVGVQQLVVSAAYADGSALSTARRQNEPLNSSGTWRKGSIAVVAPPETDSSRLAIASPTASPICPVSSSPPAILLRQPAAAEAVNAIANASCQTRREVMNAPFVVIAKSVLSWARLSPTDADTTRRAELQRSKIRHDDLQPAFRS